MTGSMVCSECGCFKQHGTMAGPSPWLRGLNPFRVVRSVVFILFFAVVSESFGESFQPVYPEKPQVSWIIRHGPLADKLRLKLGPCFMMVWADVVDGDFRLSWVQEDHPGGQCQIHGKDEPLIVEDLTHHKRMDITTFTRVLLVNVGFDISKKVDLQALIRGFASIPVSQQRYTLSLHFRREFNHALLNSSDIQLPDIFIGDRRVQLPVLRLKRYKRSGDGWWYVPVSDENISGIRGIGPSLFGGGSRSFKPADVWHEVDSVARFGAVFRGVPYTYNDDWTHNEDHSEIYGQIFVEVFGGKTIHYQGEGAFWSAPGDEIPKPVSVEKSKWELKRYTTNSISDRLDHLQDYFKNRHFVDRARKFWFEIPDYQPKHIKITLPQVEGSGHPWPILPIEFKR